jgi:hypothetical protein
MEPAVHRWLLRAVQLKEWDLAWMRIGGWGFGGFWISVSMWFVWFLDGGCFDVSPTSNQDLRQSWSTFMPLDHARWSTTPCTTPLPERVTAKRERSRPIL